MNKLTLRTKLGFGIGDLGGNLFFTIMGFYLLFFLTDVVGMLPALAGTALMIGKIWDAITDPITGYYSDRTKSRWGRRRPYMFVGAIVSFFSMILIFTPVAFTTQGRLFIYFTFVYCLLNTAYTLVNIPYAALLPELTQNYDQRTTLTGWRMSFAVIGTFFGAALVMPLVDMIGWSAMGTFMGAVMLFSAMATIVAIREPKDPQISLEDGFVKTFAEVLKERIFLSALLPWTFFITGTSMVQGALVYYFSYLFGNEGLFQIALIALLFFSLACIPLWVRISNKIGKKRSYIVGMAIMSVGILAFSLLGQIFGPIFGIAMMGFSGIGLSTHYIMPHAILPDIVEWDAANKRRGRREGVYSSLWTFSSKLGQALALALNGWILALVGYAATDVTPLAKVGIVLLCGPLPVLWYLGGLWIFKHYPIDRSFYEAMLMTEDAR